MMLLYLLRFTDPPTTLAEAFYCQVPDELTLRYVRRVRATTTCL
jgi:hypothetical protein